MIKLLAGALTCVLAFAALTTGAAAASPDHGALKGKTRQGRTIRLALRSESVQIKRFTIELRCRDGSYLIDEESGFVPTRLRRGGRIRDHQVGNTDDVWIRGKLGGRVLRGTIRVHDRLGKAQCDSHWVRFHARLRG
jgi:hypothetical protein